LAPYCRETSGRGEKGGNGQAEKIVKEPRKRLEKKKKKNVFKNPNRKKGEKNTPTPVVEEGIKVKKKTACECTRKKKKRGKKKEFNAPRKWEARLQTRVRR